MKVNQFLQTNFYPQTFSGKKDTPKTTDNPITELSENASVQSARAQVKSTNSVVEKIIEPFNYKIRYNYGDVYAVGAPIEGFPNLCSDDGKVRCVGDEMYFLNTKAGELGIYDLNGDRQKYFSKEDMKSLKEYKYSPNAFHDFLRFGRISYLPPQQELDNYINRLSSMFEDDTKSWRTTEPKIVYRALQEKLSNEQIDALSQVGGVFKETSFVSTTEKLDTAKRFSCGNPIMEIELPKDSRYIAMDKIFNVDREHWREQECMLNKDSQFVVTGYDKENNIIKVRYLRG